MSSRIRENVKHLFECFCEIVPSNEEKGDPWIIQQYPNQYKDKEILKSVPKFAYPYKFENIVIQHYSFVLTDLESKWTYGYCRHDPKSETAIVVLSYLPWHQSFYKFLDTIAVLMHSSRSEDLSEFLYSAYTTRIAEPGRKMIISYNSGQNNFIVDVPKPFQLPSIPEDRNLTEYYNAVDTNNMMIIFASMLYERRIIVISKQLKRLSACVQSANDIIYPMIWQHIFIPLLPIHLIDYLLAPMPFLIGVPEEVMKKVSRSEIGDVVILDADNNTIETPFDDLNNLPQDVINSLRKQLKTKSAEFGDGLSRAFLKALVQLIGGYRDALKFHPGEKVSFDAEKFIETRSNSLQPFLREMLRLQIFQQFIEERLMMLNTGRGFSDEFEFELEHFSMKSAGGSTKLKQQYRDWTSSMRKEGTAFLKSVKDKANPAMKSAVKTVKDGGKGMKSAYKGLRSKLKDGQNNDVKKPRSAPSSPTTTKRKIMSDFKIPLDSYKKDAALAIKNANLQRSYSPLSPNDSFILSESDQLSKNGIEIPQINLMNELEDLFNLKLDESTKSLPPVDRSLKPVRSLENVKNLTSPERIRSSFFPSSSEFPHLSLRNHHHHQHQENLLCGGNTVIVGGGQNENGDSLFYLANQNMVDVVKLTPPLNNYAKKRDHSEDLIRLDSTSDSSSADLLLDDFDPLKSSSSSNLISMNCTNPLYDPSSSSSNATSARVLFEEQNLLKDYGLNFNFDGPSIKRHTKNQWTKFD